MSGFWMPFEKSETIEDRTSLGNSKAWLKQNGGTIINYIQNTAKAPWSWG